MRCWIRLFLATRRARPRTRVLPRFHDASRYNKAWVVVAAACLLAVPEALSQQGKLYWATTDGLWRSNLDGGSGEQLQEGQIDALAIDPCGQKLYWATPGGLHRSELNGANPEPIPGLSPHALYALAVDPHTERIYWTERQNDRGAGGGLFPAGLFRANLDGSRVERLLTVPDITALALPPHSEKIYFAARQVTAPGDFLFTRWSIFDATRDADDAHLLVERSSFPFRDVQVDTLHHKLYWCEDVSSRRDGRLRSLVMRSELDGSDRRTLLVLTRIIPPIHVDPVRGMFFWVQTDGIYRGDLNASDPQRIVPLDVPLDKSFVHDLVLWTPPGDFDRDGDVDLADLLTLQSCVTGPGEPLADDPACHEADLDFDRDVDLADLVAFQAHFTGAR